MSFVKFVDKLFILTYKVFYLEGLVKGGGEGSIFLVEEEESDFSC